MLNSLLNFFNALTNLEIPVKLMIMIESREPRGIAPLREEKPPETEEIFDKPRFEAELQRIKDFLWAWHDEPSEEEIKVLIQNIIKDAGVLAEALHVQSAFYDSLEALNTLAEINNCAEFLETATSIIAKNMPTIEGYIRSDKIFFNHTCLEAANNLVRCGNEEQRRLGISVLSDHVDALALGIKYYHSSYVYFIETIVGHGGTEVAQRAISILRDGILLGQSGEIKNYDLLGFSFTSRKSEIREVADFIISDKLSSYGLSVEKFLDAWRVSLPASAFGSGERIKNNILAIQILEAQKPGVVGFLNKEFGIYDFGRYPAEMLLWQHDNYDNNKLPYGVVFYPKNDHNGAFYENVGVFRQLFEQLKGKFEIRVGEGESKIDIVKLLHKLNRKYGEKHKISFAIIGGHGEKTSIQFGGEDEKHSLKAWDLWDEKHPVSKKAGYFENEPTFILNSCSTGVERGIAKVLSDEMKAIVIAPTEPTNIKSVEVEIRSNKPVFSVEYRKKKSSRTYTSGNASSVSTNGEKI